MSTAGAGGQAPTPTIRREDPMTSQPLRVGIVGLQPGRSWAARAHVPALRALSADFVVAGIANTTLASAVQAAAALARWVAGDSWSNGIPRMRPRSRSSASVRRPTTQTHLIRIQPMEILRSSRTYRKENNRLGSYNCATICPVVRR
jgi:hypothetical protein